MIYYLTQINVLNSCDKNTYETGWSKTLVLKGSYSPFKAFTASTSTLLVISYLLQETY